MKLLKAVFPIVLSVFACSILTSQAWAGVSCHEINAKGIGQDLGGGMTEAQIKGGGLLNGTTEALFEIIGGEPPVLVFNGTVTFTVNKATLTVFIEGTFNVSSGAFFGAGPVTESTGKLEGAVGVLVFDGIQDLSDGTFIETVTGQICVDLSPKN